MVVEIDRNLTISGTKVEVVDGVKIPDRNRVISRVNA